MRAHCLAELGRTANAAEAYAKAISLCTDRPSQQWLEKKTAELRKKYRDVSIGDVPIRRVGRREEKAFVTQTERIRPMTIVYIILTVIAAVALIALLLPRKVAVTRHADIDMSPEDVVARVASTEGFQTFSPYCTTDPELKITHLVRPLALGPVSTLKVKKAKATRQSQL